MRLPRRITVLGLTAALALASLAGPAAGAATPANTANATTGQAPALDRAHADFFVAPDGDDRWTGRRPTRGPDDAGPFATVERAQRAVRAARAKAKYDRPYVVLLRGGTYRLNRPITFGPKDSGSAEAPVSYVAAPGERPVLSGGRSITGWREYDADAGIWRARAGKGQLSRQLYVDGVRAIRARGEENPSGFERTDTGYAIDDPALAKLKRQRHIEVNSVNHFKNGRCPIERIEPTRIVMQQPCWDNSGLGPNISPSLVEPRWLENAYEFIDADREWYHDPDSGWVYYKPAPGEDLTTADVTMPVLDELVRGTGEPGAPLRHLRFEGLTFADTTWLRPGDAEGYPSLQAGVYISGEGNETYHGALLHHGDTIPEAVRMSGVRDVDFTGNRFVRLGGAGLGFRLGSQDNQVVGNVFTDISGSGVQIGGVSQADQRPGDDELVVRDNLVANNVVHGVGVEYQASVGIFAGWTAGTTVRNNTLFDLPYTGISVGWGWGYYAQDGLWPEHTQYDRWRDLVDRGVLRASYDTPTTLRDSTIVDNHVFDIMNGLSDGAAVYTLSAQPGSVIRGNYFHTAHDAGGVGGQGIYLDEGSRYFDVTDNVVCDIANERWLLLHSTRDVVVTDTYADSTGFDEPGGVDNTVDDPTPLTGGEPPAAARAIVEGAGVEPAYADLLPDDVPEDDPATVCG